MTDGERQCSAAAAFISGASISTSQINNWVKESRSWLIKKRRKSVENLLMTGQDVIGSSIGSSLTFNTMTLPNVSSQTITQGQQSQITGESSPNPSPQPSPRPSPRQHKKDQQKSDSGSNTKESSPATDRFDVSNIDLVLLREKSIDQSERKSLGSSSQASSNSAASGKSGNHSSGVSSSGKSSWSISRSCSTTSDTSFHTTEDNVSRGSDSSQADISRSISHESAKERKESRGSDRSKKKSSWYNILYPTYKSRSKDFNRIFKDVPPEERLIVDYSCAVAKEILIHGRLYVSQNYLCFYANIFRWETLISLRWKDVTAITKEKTALVIPNAILVCTETENLFFTTFGARDKAYLMLFRVWQNALMDQQMSMQEMWQWVHACYGQELGLTSEDEDYIEPLPIVEGNSRLSMESFSEDGLASPEDSLRVDDSKPQTLIPVLSAELASMEVTGNSAVQTAQPLPSISSPSSVTSPNSISTNNPEAQLDTDMSDTTESEADKVSDLIGLSSGSGQCTSQHDGRQMLQVVLPVSVDQLFTLFFTNSKFFVDFHVARNSCNIKPSAWAQNAKNERLRTVCLTVNINQAVVGKRQSQVTETQAMLKCSKPGKMYAIESDCQNAGIPYADSFSIITHYCLNKVSETESSFAVYCDIKYKKSVWTVVKSFIEKHTWAGLDEFYAALEKALQAECCADEEIAEDVEVAPKIRRRLRSSSRRLSSSRHNDEVLVPRARSSTGRQVIPAVTNGVETVNVVILGILILLLVLNGALYYKLICLERWSAIDPIPVGLNEDLQSLRYKISKNPPTTQEEWMRLLRQQESLHTLEMQKWQKVLQSSVILLRETEDSLKELQMSIQPRVKHKITPAIKELTDNVDKSQYDNS
ncbi:protein Aster-B isoform X3 [Frankliniella occidentalis]|uniref:Protein Aster-B isoform X3 n=1 Tax=Frankliniella occidentalis TaxID=133901 RepID=A0A6J1S5V7_FRAOC|nr:protein Aster-B isoform X3 [Frankliniella occidentalis]